MLAQALALNIFSLGGHTSEALTLISSLPFHRYSPRTYIISEGDTLSAQKVIALETSKSVQQIKQVVSFLFLAIRARTSCLSIALPLAP
jgi:beta-1,4-N-acetylglucosaminyltransferase